MLFIALLISLINCDPGNSFKFENENIKVDFLNFSSNCIVQCENQFEDYSTQEYCYKDTCKKYTIFLSYNEDKTTLGKFIDFEFDKLKTGVERAKFVEIEKKISNENFLRKSIWYELNVESYNALIISNDGESVKTNYLNYGLVGINSEGSYHISLRKEIDVVNFHNDLSWSNEFESIFVNFK
ncbi:MAG: hypothetical protein ACJATI_000892 [Halioglobus sp.]|jgi:hypothetical protein